MGTLRRELLDHFVILSERHLSRVLKEYSEYYSQFRPHQGIGQLTPVRTEVKAQLQGTITTLPVLGGLQHHYQRVA